jgi:acyl-CoA thioester hydrolase
VSRSLSSGHPVGYGSATPTIPTFHPPPTLRDGAHHYAVRVYYEDTDAAGVVYHANYLKLAERARTEALRDLGIPHADLVREHALMFMVRRAKLDYLRPARLDDSLVVVTRALAVGGASVELRQSFLLAGTAEPALVVAHIQLACVRQVDMRAARMPPRWRDAMAALSAG